MTMTIKSRLILLISVMLLLLAGVGLLGLNGMATANRAAVTLYYDNLHEAQQFAEVNELMRDAMMELAISAQHDPRLPVSALHDHPTGMHLDNVRHNLAQIDSRWDDLMEAPRSAEANALVGQFNEQYQRLVDNGITPAMPLYDAKDFDSANRIVFVEAMPPFREMMGTLQSLVEYEDAQAAAGYRAAEAYSDRLRLIVIAVLIAGLALGSILGWILMQRILRPLAQARHHLQQMADGNLTDNIQAHSRDEIGQMLMVLADTRDRIRDLIIDIQRSAESISTASTQIATGNTDLSQRTEEQASSLQETAASMDQVAATVKNNTDHTSQANRLAREASQSASSGGERAHQAVEKMREMAKSSGEISSIISLINGIAFQTNILALNASVEAARAGEQGRGFAVVAGEVRNLAQRSADAAKQIQGLIDHNGEVVHQGSELVESVGNAMQEIVDNIGRVSTLMDEVSRASDEQTLAIDQVSVAISQMDEVTQQNAALVEQTATASASLEDQARDLTHSVRIFRVGATPSLSQNASPPPLVDAPRPLGRSTDHSSQPATGRATGHVPSHQPATPQQQPAAPRRLAGQQRKAPATSDEGDWESF
ncbi:MAG: methyl-accepting chemotaxis protein [Halomonas sp.]|uniref:methyl-accepting chemotaxis protein n=1 Tax=Halomonas sp. TaxID=1486246 RepID=UPI003970A1DE